MLELLPDKPMRPPDGGLVSTERDFIGYGQTPPQVRWPNDAKIAISVVINYEEGGENNILHGDEASEAFLSEIVGAAPRPGQRHLNMESIYEYGSRAGFWRLPHDPALAIRQARRMMHRHPGG